MRPIAIYHEHPDWFRPLFAELERRGLPYVRLDAASHVYDPSATDAPYALVFNRASPSAYLRGHSQSTFFTLQWLRHVERLGVPVVNGSAAYTVDTSKALQLDILAELAIPSPRTHVANSPAAVVAAARELRFPVLVKANVGAVARGSCDSTTREHSMPRRRRARSISVSMAWRSCRSSPRCGLQPLSRRCVPDDRWPAPRPIGVRGGCAALSNFVADARRVVGFDPHERLVDYLISRCDAGELAAAGAAR